MMLNFGVKHKIHSSGPFRLSVPRAMVLVVSGLAIILSFGCSSSDATVRSSHNRPMSIVYQPSHQTDTGENFSEAAVCNGIVEAAISAHSSTYVVHKVWSYDVPGLRYARQGSNTRIEHTSRVAGDSLTGYAWEVKQSNALGASVFISVHNNGATNSHAIWGFIHEGDEYEEANRELADALVTAVAEATGLEHRGVLFDNSVGRNDYRCVTTGKRAFYSLDENVNHAPYRVLLEIGDNAVSRDFLQDPAHQRTMGKIIARVVEERFGS